MSEQNFAPKKLLDFLSQFSGGMNAGVSPELIGRDQISNGVNVSVRGGYAKTRPRVSNQPLNFNGNSKLQSIVTKGLFQGAGYYKPDVGVQSLAAQFSGHLCLFTPAGTQWIVTDISVPNDINDSTVKQVWMWQSEKWLIVQDGTGKLPIFYDGNTSRRSYGKSIVLATVSGTPTPGTPAGPGSQITVTLTAPYSGPFGVAVIFNKEFYQINQANTNSFQVTLMNLTGQQGATEVAGSNVVIKSSSVGYIQSIIDVSSGGFGFQYFDCIMSSIAGLAVGNFGTGGGAQVNIAGTVANAVSVNAANNQVRFQRNVANNVPFNPPLYTPVNLTTSSGTNTSLGTLASGVAIPAIGATTSASLSQVYSGSANQVVYIGNDAYAISPVAAPSGSTVYLINISDNSTAAYASGLTIQSVPELPAGRMGAYGMGCNCMSLIDGISYIVGDVVGAGSGTAANNYRDAVLKVTQNEFLMGGGSFRIPGSGDVITAITFPPVLDTSLGQGPLQISTAVDFFSNVTPGTDPSGWESLTTPIQSVSLEDQGALGQNSTVRVNSDTYFRCDGGIGSLLLARREFADNSPGNKLISNEISTLLHNDNQSLLQYSSAIVFGNRMIMTTNPVVTANGVAHQGLVSLNTDLMTSMRTTLPASWEGLWTGLNIFQMVTGKINGITRAFAFSFNAASGANELYEFLNEASSATQDNGAVPNFWAFETPIVFGSQVHPVTELVQLRDGEVYVSNIVGAVTIKVFYRPDYYPGWTLWNTIQLSQSTDGSNSKPGYYMRAGLGEPSVSNYETTNNRPLRNGYFFQLRIEITGSCTFKGIRLSAVTVPTPTFAPLVNSTNPPQIIDITLPNDLTTYQLQGSIT